MEIVQINSLKEKFDLHPLLFQRSVEKAKTIGDLFDILSTIPSLPVVWDERTYRWKSLDDFQFRELSKELD